MGQLFKQPEIGQWYRDIENRIFEVVACDDDSIEVQYYDGDVEELDEESWELLCIQQIDEPRGGLGIYESDDEDDIQITENLRPTSWEYADQ